METYLTTSSVARVLGISPDWVRSLARKGQLACIRTDTGTRLFLHNDVLTLLQKRAIHRRAINSNSSVG